MDDSNYLPPSKRLPETLIRRALECSGREHGTPHGLMLLRGELTKTQYAACNWFEGLYEKYLTAIDRKRGIRSSTGERVDRGHAPDPFSPVGWEIAADEHAVVKRFDSARMAGMTCGEGRFKVFWCVVIEGDQPLSRDQKGAVGIVSNALDKHRSRGWKSRRRK